MARFTWDSIEGTLFATIAQIPCVTSISSSFLLPPTITPSLFASHVYGPRPLPDGQLELISEYVADALIAHCSVPVLAVIRYLATRATLVISTLPCLSTYHVLHTETLGGKRFCEHCSHLRISSLSDHILM